MRFCQLTLTLFLLTAPIKNLRIWHGGNQQIMGNVAGPFNEGTDVNLTCSTDQGESCAKRKARLFFTDFAAIFSSPKTNTDDFCRLINAARSFVEWVFCSKATAKFYGHDFVSAALFAANRSSIVKGDTMNRKCWIALISKIENQIKITPNENRTKWTDGQLFNERNFFFLIISKCAHCLLSVRVCVRRKK